MEGRYFESLQDVQEHLEVEASRCRDTAGNKTNLVAIGGSRLKDAGGKNAVERERQYELGKAWGYEQAVEMLKDIKPAEYHAINHEEFPESACPICGMALPEGVVVTYPEPYKPWRLTFADTGEEVQHFVEAEDVTKYIADHPGEKYEVKYIQSLDEQALAEPFVTEAEAVARTI